MYTAKVRWCNIDSDRLPLKLAQKYCTNYYRQFSLGLSPRRERLDMNCTAGSTPRRTPSVLASLLIAFRKYSHLSSPWCCFVGWMIRGLGRWHRCHICLARLVNRRSMRRGRISSRRIWINLGGFRGHSGCWWSRFGQCIFWGVGGMLELSWQFRRCLRLVAGGLDFQFAIQIRRKPWCLHCLLTPKIL